MDEDNGRNNHMPPEGSTSCSDEPQPDTIAAENSHPWRPQDADKEIMRQAIRMRVRNAAVSKSAVFIPARPKPTIHDTDCKTVAVYARVSTKSTEQVSSIENQTKYYTEKIEQTPNWTMQQIYSDEGKSGTSMRKRTEFRRMLHDAAEKKMDLILCASVSRFARNVSDCIKQVTKLQTVNPSHPVGVYFETEDIYTLDPDSKQLLSIHALLADWESANKSRRMILSYDQRICTGQYPVADLLGYRHTADGNLIIQEEEAKTVRLVFLAYLCGFTCKEIAGILTSKGRPTRKGRTDWNANMVRYLMTNERRWGDLCARKTIVIDYSEGKTVKNNNVRDAAFVPGHHAGIVTPEIAKATKMMIPYGRKVNSGISEVMVIERAALKGFVSMNPGWGGINAESIYSLCRSVYSDEEFADLESEARVLSGKEHSNMMSMQFAGYQVPYGVYFIGPQTPTLTISTRTIRFNKACFERFQSCKYVEMLYHPILQTIAIRESNENRSNAFCWINEDGSQIQAITATTLCRAIYDQTHWIQEYRFRFRGITKVRGDTSVMLFFLDEPQILVGSGKTKTSADVEQVQFIPYKESNGNNRLNTMKKPFLCAYPDEWKAQSGMNYDLRKLRDRCMDTLSEEDILVPGKFVENPLLGKLPTRAEIVEELNDLLISM